MRLLGYMRLYAVICGYQVAWCNIDVQIWGFMLLYMWLYAVISSYMRLSGCMVQRSCTDCQETGRR